MAPRACVRVYARVLVPPNLYIHTYVCAARLVCDFVWVAGGGVWCVDVWSMDGVVVVRVSVSECTSASRECFRVCV